MRVTNISDFRANIKEYVDSVISDASAVVINRGNSAAVLISLEEYNSVKETELLIASPFEGELKSSIEDFKAGKSFEVGIDEL